MFESSEESQGTHHQDFDSFADAARRNCYICGPLLRDFLGKYGHDPHGCFRQPYTYERSPWAGDDLVRTYLNRRSDIGVEFIRISTSLVKGNLSVRDREGGVTLLGAVKATEVWLEKCLGEHWECQQNLQPSSYPTRVLELGDATLRVVRSDEERLSGPYAALSYCWGPNPTFLRLGAANGAQLHAGIPYSDLPIAFREAAYFVKGLSLRYLWIDSLCIIQSGPEHEEDWLRESVRMQDVYANCYLNISLSKAAHPGQSCLGEGCHDSPPPFKIKIRDRAKRGGGKLAEKIYTLFYEAEKTYAVFDIWYYNAALYSQPVASRAWVLQERLLSPRVLSFGQGEVFWDCAGCRGASESLPVGLGWWGRLAMWFGVCETTIPGSTDPKKLRRIWYDVLYEYTRRQLTNPESDKLVALQAVADRMASAMGDSLVVGHFRKTLPSCLSWRVQYRGETRRLSRSAVRDGRLARTPSWSWASVDGPLDPAMWSRLDERLLAKLEKCTIAPLDRAAPDGPAVSASLRISTVCKELEWDTESEHGFNELEPGDFRWVSGDGFMYLYIQLDDPTDAPEEGARITLALLAGDAVCDEGLVLRGDAVLDGEKAYFRIGHFRWGKNVDLARWTWRRNASNIFETEPRSLLLV